MKDHIYSKRAFLNKPEHHSNASLVTNISESLYGDDGFYATYKISDCKRTVEISIDLNDMEDYNNTIFKMNKIIEVTKSFRDKLKTLKTDIIKLEKKRELKNP